MRSLSVGIALAVVASLVACDSLDRTLPTEESNVAVPPSLHKHHADRPEHFRAHLLGANEVPPRTTDARAKLRMRLSRDGLSLNYVLTVSHISNVTQSHIHIGAAGVNGGVVVFLFGLVPAGGGPVQGLLAKGTLTGANLINALAGHPLSDLIDSIEVGHAYANVHTSDGVDPANTGPGDFPGGEVRAQVEVVGHDHHGHQGHGHDD